MLKARVLAGVLTRVLPSHAALILGVGAQATGKRAMTNKDKKRTPQWKQGTLSRGLPAGQRQDKKQDLCQGKASGHALLV